jgi:SOS-response transcriptional repressor LexA
MLHMKVDSSMDIAHRLRLARERKGYKSAREAAAAMGAPYGTYAGHENGNRGIKPADIARYAKFFKVLPAWLQFGEENSLSLNKTDQITANLGEPIDIKNVKVIGTTQAGTWTEFENFEDDGLDGLKIPAVPGKWSNLPQFAYKVRGASMDLDRIYDGDFLICVPYFDARADITEGDRVVIERVRNSAIERSVKQIEIHGKEIHFCPRSSLAHFLPIKVKVNRHMREADDTEVRLVALVIGRWSPF